MSKKLEGKIAVITGANSGIGLAGSRQGRLRKPYGAILKSGGAVVSRLPLHFGT